MVSRTTESAKRFLTFLLIFSVVSSTFYAPLFTPKAKAFWGIADTTVDVPAWVNRIVDGISMTIAQTMIDHMVASTVKWAQSGFEGNPAYVTDPKQYFTNIADGAAGEFIKGTDLGFLCSPFQANIKLSLTQQYYEPEAFKCSITGIAGNIENFYTDFSNGGWDTWFSMTQTPTNNPYGAYLAAKVELDSRIAEKLNIEQDKLNWNQGFLSWSECIVKDPDTQECLGRGPTQTPGSTIKAQLDKVLPSGLDKLITAQHIDQLVSGVAAGLLNKYVFGSKGLFAKKPGAGTSTTNPASTGNVPGRSGEIDVDQDGIPDGYDGDRDGILAGSSDTCFHGGKPPMTSKDKPCPNSLTVTSSPYFTPVCEAIDETIVALNAFTKFIDVHADQVEGGSSLSGQVIGAILAGPVGHIFVRTFIGGGSADNFTNKADAEIWGNRASEVDSAVGNLVSNIQSRKSPYFDNMEIATNRFANYTGRIFESLIKDQDLDLGGVGRSGGGGLENIMKNSAYNLRYLKEVKVQMGKCESPNAKATSGIATPPVVEESDINGPADADPGSPTAWTWTDRGGPAFESRKCPSINPEDYLDFLKGDANIDTWQETLANIEPQLWACGIGQQRSSGGEVRGRIYLPTNSCPDAAPGPSDGALGVNQNPSCWEHPVDVVGN